MIDDPSNAMPAACRGWIERWLGVEHARAVAERLGPWTPERTLRWSYVVVDAAAREVAATVLETAGASEFAARHRALKPVRDPESAATAIRELSESMGRAQSIGVLPLCFHSTSRAVEEALRLDEEYRHTGSLDPIGLEGLFAEAACLDMSSYRAIASGTSREAIIALYRARTLEDPFFA